MEAESKSLAAYVRFLAGRPPAAATPQDWLHALAALVRERVGEQWAKSAEVARSPGIKRVCYLSMEFLPGRLLIHSLQRLGLYETCRRTLADQGLDLAKVADLEPDPALGNGGLGRLAACLLDSLANLGLPAYGYGIRYDRGVFAQYIENGWQKERPDPWLRYGNLWEIPRREILYPVSFGGRVVDPGENDGGSWQWVDTEQVLATAYDIPVPGYESGRVNTLRLWSACSTDEFDLQSFNNGDHHKAFSRKNSAESLSQVLYPNDDTPAGRELRFKQEYFFVSASIRDILRRFQRSHHSFERLPDSLVIQINDTHPALAIAELVRVLVDVHCIAWDRAWDITRRTFAYTNHTLMPEAMEVWSIQLFETLLPRHLQIIYDINDRFLRDVARWRSSDHAVLRRVSLVDEEGERRIRMAHLAVVGSRVVNGVSRVHTSLMKHTVFADFDALYPGKIVNVTNGVTFRRWLHEANPSLVSLICSRIGDRWLTRPEELLALTPHAEDSAFRAAFRAVKRENKTRLAEAIERERGIAVELDSIFDVQIKRIHEYKRQLLKLLHVVALYDRIRRDTTFAPLPRTVILAGKAASGYAMAKLIVKLIHDVAEVVNKDPDVSQFVKVVFIPDYSVSKAQKIIPAADLSEQISTAGHEASGTGNMKLGLNGALTIGTLDGANIEIREAVGEENFFAFGATIEEVARVRAGNNGPSRHYQDDAELMRALDLIVSGHFSPSQPDRFTQIFESLIMQGDPYLVLADFESYLQCQERVEGLYSTPEEWTRQAILNVARLCGFSSDRAVRGYAELVWNTDTDQTPGCIEGFSVLQHAIV
jgi:glycogen phosphorylase